jgi:hypothetical protein
VYRHLPLPECAGDGTPHLAAAGYSDAYSWKFPHRDAGRPTRHASSSGELNRIRFIGREGARLTTGSGQGVVLFNEHAPMVREAGRRGLPES